MVFDCKPAKPYTERRAKNCLRHKKKEAVNAYRFAWIKYKADNALDAVGDALVNAATALAIKALTALEVKLEDATAFAEEKAQALMVRRFRLTSG